MKDASNVESNQDHRARLVIVEHRLEEVSKSVSALADSFNRWMKDASSAPRPIPAKEIIATAVSCLVLFVGILTFFDSRISTSIEIARAKNYGSEAVSAYRLATLEQQVKELIASRGTVK